MYTKGGRQVMHRGKTVFFIEPRAGANTFSGFMSIPLLGPVYLATLARQAGYDAWVYNENILGRSVTDDELAQADQLCLSCLTATVEQGIEIAQRYRRVRHARGLPALAHIGGIHASMMPEDVAPYFDHVVVGEGEYIIEGLLAGAYQERIIHGEPVNDLDTVPIPNFSLVKGWRGPRITPVMTSRGCPYDCNFCSVTEMFGRKYRAKSPERVLKEIMRYPKGYIFFVDDNFAGNTIRLRRILTLMKERGFARPWTAQFRTSITEDPSLVAEMKARGCYWVFVGFESINPQSLKDLRKRQSVEDIQRSVRVFHQNNIRVHGMFILGGDSDTDSVFRTTTEFVCRHKVDTVQFSILTPLPGTPLFRRIAEEGRLLHRQWRYYDGLHVVFRPKNFSAGELQQGVISCFNDFYTYTHALSDAISTGMKSMMAAGKRLITPRVPWPSFSGPLMKFVGRGYVKQWIRENASYVRYLRGL
ncbi:MAG: radical SAM protein [Chitinivibrionales bacterium]|nr:radical SAM protein [Chitinivibrionales bacterium]MBD3356156.1 radical SAM protein [Chitinivibrionales bacterium]